MRERRLHVILRITSSPSSIGLIRDPSSNLDILRGGFDPPSVHIILEIRRCFPQRRFSKSADLILISDELEVWWHRGQESRPLPEPTSTANTARAIWPVVFTLYFLQIFLLQSSPRVPSWPLRSSTEVISFRGFTYRTLYGSYMHLCMLILRWFDLGKGNEISRITRPLQVLAIRPFP